VTKSAGGGNTPGLFRQEDFAMAHRSPVLVESTQHVNRNLAVAGALLAITLACVWAIRGGGQAVQSVDNLPAAMPPGGAWVGDTAPPARNAGVTRAEPAGVDDPELEFRKYVDAKYRYLFRDDARAAQDQGALHAALLERERIAVAINTARQSDDSAEKNALPAREAQLAEIDRKIGALLSAAQLTAFDVLKDSDIEQFQLDDYAAGIANVAPLGEADKQSILYTKLVYRQRFRQVLNDSGLMRGDLGATERKVVFGDVSRALSEYQTNYLQEVRQYLYNDEQYTLLANYENSEYRAELAKLKSIAGLE
jgi:hypothetical protein